MYHVEIWCIYQKTVLWLIHTTRDQEQDRDGYNKNNGFLSLSLS